MSERVWEKGFGERKETGNPTDGESHVNQKGQTALGSILGCEDL